MPSTLSLSCSKKLYELLGETYQTKGYWVPGLDMDGPVPTPTFEVHSKYYGAAKQRFPAPSFSETIRLLPKIAKKKGWADYECPLFFQDVGTIYMSAPTEEEGMKRVSDYLEALL
jgi:hypothetical protein